MTHEEKARSLFRGKDKLNCAQAVAKAFGDDLDVTDEIIADLAKMGGGRAKDGVCGALFAAQKIVTEIPSPLRREGQGEGSKSDSSENLVDDINAEFLDQVETLKCKEIRKAKKVDCRSCVGLAARLLSQRLD